MTNHCPTCGAEESVWEHDLDEGGPPSDDECPAYEDGQHCFAVNPSNRIVETDPQNPARIVAVSSDLSKYCACGAVVKRS